MSGMIAHHVSNRVPFFTGPLVHCVHLIGPPVAHELLEEVVRLVGVKSVWSAHPVPVIFHVLLEARGMRFCKLVRVVHVRVRNML